MKLVPDPGLEPESTALQEGFLLVEPLGSISYCEKAKLMSKLIYTQSLNNSKNRHSKKKVTLYLGFKRISLFFFTNLT